MSCNDDAVVSGIANRRPETRLFVNDVNASQSSRIDAHWQGDDMDGIVVGYALSWDERNWFYTEKNDSVFSLQISTNDSAYVFAVSAIDNSLGTYPAEGSRLQFADSNSNGFYDDGEEFIALTGAADITPARTKFPVRNSPPEIYFGSDTTAAAARRVQLPDTTFAVATFQFNLFDIDGETSIKSVEYALNDTVYVGSWRQISPKTTFFTVKEEDGLRMGEQNKIFLRTTDIGGLRSKTLVYPPENKQWFVRKTSGNVLLVKDESDDEAAIFYQSVMQTVAGGQFAGKFDLLDIGYDKKAGRSKSLPPFLNPMLTESFKLYKVIIWFADARPTFTVAQETLSDYLAVGGKILFCTELPEIMTADSQTVIADFAPLDSVSRTEVVSDPLAIKNGTEIIALTGSKYPNLTKNKGSITVHELYPKITASPLYRLPQSSKWSGTPAIGVMSADGNFIFMNLPLHYLNGGGSAEEFLRYILKEQFGL
ncbi:hypothetical protein MASR2M18_21220 [Ignavibacteria bacterium]|nr:hypothetical protein [Bacteroidota bacterium]MCZ2131664.1 hypothetical protein [Bacteroidota bacterium]